MTMRIMLVVAAIMMFFASSVQALEMLAGAKVWYVSWRPYLIDVGEKIAPWEGWQYIRGGSGMMYGPSASFFITDRLVFSVSYLYGELGTRYNADFVESNGDPAGTNLLVEYHFSGYARTIRHDLDSAISYSLTRNFKVFAGFKYQPLKLKVNKQGGFWDLDDTTGARQANQFYYIDKNRMTFTQQNYAPGIGLGYTMAISDKFTLTMNVSFIYLFGTFDINTGDTYYYPPGTYVTPDINPGSKFSFDSYGFGLNAEPGIVVMLNEKILLNLGFRFQYVRISIRNADGLDDTEGLNDYVYGVYLAALYRL